MKTVGKFCNKLIYYLLAFAMLATTLVLCANVVLRYIFHASFSWSEEFARYLIVWVTFVGTSACVVEGSDISIDTLMGLLPKAGQRIVSVFTILLSILFMGIFGYYSLILTMQTVQSGQMTTALKIPMYIVYAAMPVGSALTIFRYIMRLIGILRAKPEDTDAEPIPEIEEGETL